METESTTAFVFPGMGPTAFADVAKFMLINPFARELVSVADETLGYSLMDRFRDADGDYSEYAQVAFLVNCLALAQWGRATLEADPALCLGPSFGNKAAAVFSGALSAEDGIRLTAEFARCLDAYFGTEHTDLVTQSFARVPADRLRELCEELDEQGEWHDVTCTVDHDFHMLTLAESRTEWLQGRLRAIGGLPLYIMRPPMHSAAFEGLRRKAAAEVIDKLTFAQPDMPVVSDHDGSLLTTGDAVRNLLLDGCVRRVDWPAALGSLKERGVRRLVVTGQDALFGRVGAATKNFEVTGVDPRLAMRPRRRVPGPRQGATA
ncbi:ACP S-malonyltransferase [Streptomyces sp. NPDC004647]|uniref:ACP S-malonyltransferase n=1 Tax=Streptomyces sp. NPDC004647 TaxID=3154671 RepID=UPI0033AA889D